MDRSPCCWNKKIAEVFSCPCDTCILEELAELPFSSDIPHPIEMHDEQLGSMISACNRAYSTILRMESILVTRPDLVNARLIPKIIKQHVLLASLKVYDSCFENYMGPASSETTARCMCTCWLFTEADLKLPYIPTSSRSHNFLLM